MTQATNKIKERLAEMVGCLVQEILQRAPMLFSKHASQRLALFEILTDIDPLPGLRRSPSSIGHMIYRTDQQP